MSFPFDPHTPLNLEQQRKRAKDLLRAQRDHNMDAAARFKQHLPRARSLSTEEVIESLFTLADAQFVIAREAGFASWPKMKQHIESAATASPFIGTWCVNLAQSRLHPANAFQKAMLCITIDGDMVTFANIVVSESGQEERSGYTIKADGKDHLTERSSHAGVATWLGTHLLEVLDKKDGEVVGRGTYVVSSDGKTLTITSPIADQVIVLDRLGFMAVVQ